MKSTQEVERELESLKASIAQFSRLEDISADVVDCICHTLEIERCSLWQLDEYLECLRCELLLEVSNGILREPITLRQKDYPQYFNHLLTGEPLVASNAREYEATREFKELYLVPNGIYSMLDVPIIKDEKIKGIICCEQCKSMKDWQPEEQAFVRQVAELITPFF